LPQLRWSAAALVVGLALLFGHAVAHADENCRGHSCNDAGGDTVVDIDGSVDVSTSVPVNVTANPTTNVDASPTMTVEGSNYESRALALANSLGDVDIAGAGACLGSEQFGTPLFSRQWLELNGWCAALWYDSQGMHDAAARMRCTVKEIRALYDNDASCHESQTLPQDLVPAPALALVSELAATADEHQEEEERHVEAIEATAAELAELKAQLERERRARQAYARQQEAQEEERRQEVAEFAELYRQTVQLPEENEK
jgi:hypothetical protein